MAKFVYYNNNPYGLTEEDCVTRAISLATRLPYQNIEDKLYLTGELLNCEKLCVNCYRLLLENVFNYKPLNNVEGLYVGEFADIYPYGVYLIRVNGHLTVCIKNTIYDIWDCRDEIVTDVWRVD